MQSEDRTARAVGRPRRSVASCSVTSGGPSSLFFSRYRNVSGNWAAARAIGTAAERCGGGTPGRRRRGRRQAPWVTGTALVGAARLRRCTASRSTGLPGRTTGARTGPDGFASAGPRRVALCGCT